MNKIITYIKNHKELFTVLGLGILFYFIFFHNIWAYALMDVDESRYVSMAKDMFNSKDFLTLYLNREFFFEKPPLYFWGECLSFLIFGKITEATARFPVALYGTLCCFLTYFVGKKIVSRLYGVVSALILATSLEFVILAKFAILDIVLASCIWFSLCFGMLTLFTEEKNKKYFWWLFYIFSALAVMAKGIPGFVIPFGSMFFIYIASKKFKELFKPQFIIPGFLLFFLITLPWHIIMFKMHNPLFYDEYILKHHIARFLGEGDINRTQPFYFYFVNLLWGFFPWVFSCLAVFIYKITHKEFKFKDLTDSQRFMLYNGIIVIFTLLFFTSSKTKLITYILPVFGSLACLGGYVWTKYIRQGLWNNIISKTNLIIGGICIFISVIALFSQLYLPEQLELDIAGARSFCITSVFAFGLALTLFTKLNNRLGAFFTYVVFMLCLSAFGTEKLFEVDYKFGQDDLIEYAQYAKEQGKTITTYKFSHKYSLNFYGSDKPVEYGISYELPELKAALKKENNLVIVPVKHSKLVLQKLKRNKIKYKILDKDRKYILIEGIQ